MRSVELLLVIKMLNYWTIVNCLFAKKEEEAQGNYWIFSLFALEIDRSD